MERFTRQRVREFTNNITLSVIILFLSVVAAEVILRFTHHKCLIGNANLLGYMTYDDAAAYDISENFPPKYLYFEDSKYLVWSNELGCFDKPYTGEKDYILLAGDSFTWGVVPLEYNYGSFIENYLDYRVLKCGVVGYGTKQEFLKIQKIMKRVGKPPQLIILGYYSKNDFEDDWLFPKYSVIDGDLVQKNFIVNHITWEKRTTSDEQLMSHQRRELFSVKLWLKRHSIICNMILRSEFYRHSRPAIKVRRKLGMIAKRTKIYTPIFKQKEEHSYLKNAWEEHLNNLKKIKRLADKSSAKLLIVLIPPKVAMYKYDEGEFTKQLEEFFNVEKIDYIDMLPIFRAYTSPKASEYLYDLYWRYDKHCNKRGNELMGIIITKYILDHNLIDLVGHKKNFIEEELDRFKSKR